MSVRSSLPDLHDLLDRLPTDGTDVDLLGAVDAGAHVAAVVEQGIHPLRVADLTHLALFVGHLPIRGAFAPPLVLLVATYVFVAGAFFNKDTLPVFLVVGPAADVGVTVGVCAGTFRMFLTGPSAAGEEWTGIRMASGCDVDP